LFSGKVTTLSIEASGVRALTLNGRRVERWGRLPLAAGVVKDGLIVQPKAVGQAIDALFRSLGEPKSRVIVSLNGVHSAPRLLTLPRVKGALLEEAMRQQAKKEMPLPLEEIYLSWWPIQGKHDELEFFVVGVPRPIADAQVQTLVESGIKPYIMDLKPMALTRAVDHRDALIVDLEPNAFGITLVAEGIPVIWRTITPRQEGMVLEDMVQQLTGDVSKIVEFHNQAHPESPLSSATPVFLTGELSEDSTACELIQAGMKHPVEPLVMPLECPSDFPAASYAVNIGLALKKMAPKVRSKGATTIVRPIDFNILPERYRARRWPVRYMLFSLVAIVAIAGLFPAYQAKTHSDAEIVRLRVELDRATRQLRQARLAVDREKALTESFNKAVAAVETLEQEHRTILPKGRFAHILRPVWSFLPPGAGLTSIELALDQIILKGHANSPSLGLSYGKALEQRSIFTEVNLSELSEATFGITLKR
jgi:hypothetical protein